MSTANPQENPKHITHLWQVHKRGKRRRHYCIDFWHFIVLKTGVNVFRVGEVESAANRSHAGKKFKFWIRAKNLFLLSRTVMLLTESWGFANAQQHRLRQITFSFILYFIHLFLFSSSVKSEIDHRRHVTFHQVTLVSFRVGVDK